MAVVSRLRIAPVKGLATVTPDRVRIDEQGVPEDRRLFLLDSSGSVVTLRSHPMLIKAHPHLDLQNHVLRVHLPGDIVASSDLRDVGERVQAQLYGRARTGRVLPGAAAAALSQLAGEQLRLVAADTTGIGWDEGPVSILGRASAASVAGDDRDHARFRMLIELDGTDAFEEDTWVGHNLQIGTAMLRVTQQLQRCVIITQSPAEGHKDWEGLRALVDHGRDDLCLGVIASVVAPGEVAVGDPVLLPG